MKRSITRVIVLLVAGLLVSCGGGGGGDDTPSGSAGAPSSGTPTGNGSGGNDSGGTPPGNGSGGGTGTLPSAGARVEESEAAVILTGVWTKSDSFFGWSGGAATQSPATQSAATQATDGATASFAFTGTSVRWIGSRGTNRGIAMVNVDGGVPIPVNLYSKAFDVRIPVLTLDGLTDGPHTLTIAVTGGKDPQATSSVVVVDAFEVQPQIVSHLQETDPDVSFSAGWVHLDSGKWSGGGVKSGNAPAFGGARAAEAAGEKLTLKFRGTSIRWIGYRGPDAGIARVQVDGGQLEDIDLYAENPKVQAVVFTATGLADAPHTLTIEAMGLKRDASTSTQVVVDAFDVTTPGTRYEERDPAITYTGKWNDDDANRDNVNRVWSEGAAATTSVPGESATFSFTGTSVSWIGCEKSSIGRADVFIDDVFKERVNMTKAVGIEGYQRTIRRYDGLSNGPHRLKIVAVSGITVVDAFDVHP